ncbi:hypothetical protein [Herbaspirillum sp. 3R-3a1]|uniref:hypothetical protein n=1 Tax=Herbaspirillum sp. 3R-3a1 TaxID=2293566 RepID=UPI001313FA62|nr:hypothetical protein [Herbaspirillum sp. 3R-3a1]
MASLWVSVKQQIVHFCTTCIAGAMPTLFWRFALLFLAQTNIPIRHFLFFSQKQCIKVKHKHRRTTIVRDNFNATFSTEKFLVLYGARLGAALPPS